MSIEDVYIHEFCQPVTYNSPLYAAVVYINRLYAVCRPVRPVDRVAVNSDAKWVSTLNTQQHLQNTVPVV